MVLKHFVGFHEQLKKKIIIKNLFEQHLKFRQSMLDAQQM